ncbi:MAG: NfeD family protein [Verrucomicrobiota bacterium]
MDTALIWFLIGLGLIIAEFLVPGVILIFFGIAAWVVGLLDWFGVDSFSTQMWIFGLTSVLLLIFARRFVKDWFRGNESGTGGSDSLDGEFIGKLVTVVKTIPADDFGLVELKGAQWQATAAVELAEGERAIVVSRDTLTLTVKPRD